MKVLKSCKEDKILENEYNFEKIHNSTLMYGTINQECEYKDSLLGNIKTTLHKKILFENQYNSQKNHNSTLRYDTINQECEYKDLLLGNIKTNLYKTFQKLSACFRSVLWIFENLWHKNDLACNPYEEIR